MMPNMARMLSSLLSLSWIPFSSSLWRVFTIFPGKVCSSRLRPIWREQIRETREKKKNTCLLVTANVSLWRRCLDRVWCTTIMAIKQNLKLFADEIQMKGKITMCFKKVRVKWNALIEWKGGFVVFLVAQMYFYQDWGSQICSETFINTRKYVVNCSGSGKGLAASTVGVWDEINNWGVKWTLHFLQLFVC